VSSQFFDSEQEKNAIAYGLSTLENCGASIRQLQADMLEDVRHQRIWEAARHYYLQYSGVLDRNGLQAMLVANEVPQDKQIMYLTLLDDIKGRVVTNDKFKVAVNILGNLRFKRGLYDMINSAAGHLERGRVDQQKICNEIVNSVLNLQRGGDVTIREQSYKLSILQRIELYKDRKEHPEKYKGIPYGITKLDDLTGGMYNGELIIFTGRPSSGKCLSFSTKIATDKGLVDIASMCGHRNVGQFGPPTQEFHVPTHRGYQRVESVFYAGKKPVWRVETHRGQILEGSEDHKLFVRTEAGFEFKAIKDIKPMDWVCFRTHDLWPTKYPELPTLKSSRNQKTVSFPEKMDESLARWLGYVVAEGHTNANAIGFTNTDSAALKDFNDLTIEIFGYVPKKSKFVLQIHSKFLSRWIAELGVFGVSKDKLVPYALLNSPKSCVRSFLKSYFDGDGSIVGSKPQFEITSASKQLLSHVQLLLLGFGIFGTLKHTRKCATNGLRIYRDYWRLLLPAADSIRFVERIGLIPGGKKEQRWKKYEHLYTAARETNQIPFMEPPLRRFSKAIIGRVGVGAGLETTRRGSKGSGLGGLLGCKVGNSFYKRKWSQKRLREFLRTAKGFNGFVEYRALQDLKEHPFVYDQVSSVQNTGRTEDMFDLSVKGSHSYVANGLITHNSSLLHNVAYSVAQQNSNVLLVTIEMPNEQLSRRIDSRHLQISARGLRNATLSPVEEKKFFGLANQGINLPGDIFQIDMPQGCSVAQLLPILRRYRMRNKIDLCVIDYLNLMEPTRWSSSKVERTTDIGRELKQMARLENIPVLTAARANREAAKAETADVGTEHLSWSDAMGYDADAVFYIKKGSSISALEAEIEGVVVKFRDGSNETFKMGVNWDKSYVGDIENVLATFKQNVQTNL